MKAIETRYKGYRFRSRLEARWAVFFDTLEIEWEYEREGFTLHSGRQYLPDFYLPTVSLRGGKPGIWIEIKPTYPTGRELELLEEFGGLNLADDAATAGAKLVLLVGPPAVEARNGEGHYQMGPWWDNYMVFMRCFSCGAVKVEFLESSYDECDCGGRTWTNHPTLVAAESAALGARFEHGESGAPKAAPASAPHVNSSLTSEQVELRRRLIQIDAMLTYATAAERDALILEKIEVARKFQAAGPPKWRGSGG